MSCGGAIRPGIVFTFLPRQKVKVKLFGLDYHGRIISCIWDGFTSYRVEYAVDGKIEANTFFEEDLEPA